MAGVKINTPKRPQAQKWTFKCQPYQFSGTSEKHFSATLPLPWHKALFLHSNQLKLQGGEKGEDGLAGRVCMTISTEGF